MDNYKFKRSGFLFSVLSVCLMVYSCRSEKRIYINEDEFRDKVYACWLGKNIGGTLGMPFEGNTNIQDVSFYTNIKEGEPAANDDLDLQILWLKAMSENNAHIDAYRLGRYWMKYVPVDWNEYGVGKANMKAGWMPPVSGEFGNEKWKHSNGAWIRSEIWACLYPCNPLNAAKLAREDACVDHGNAEGTIAEIFTASIESAAFAISDRDSLIRFGLSMIPPESRVAQAVRTAVRSKVDGKNWKEAREDVIRNTEDLGWFQAPRNVAFTMIGWLYGEGDFGKSICIAVNCGDDTDCTGATLGSILGITGGTKAIPEKWRIPIGDKITNVAIKGFRAPANLDVLTDSTLSMTRRVRDRNNFHVFIGRGRTDLSNAAELLRPARQALEGIWHYSPWKIVRHNRNWVITFNYYSEPYIVENEVRKMTVSISNVTLMRGIYNLSVSGLPPDWRLSGIPSDTIGIEKGEKKSFDISIMPPNNPRDTVRMNLILTCGSEADTVPFSLLAMNRKQVAPVSN